MKAKRVACLFIFSFLFLFIGSSMGADKDTKDEGGWSLNACFGYLYAFTQFRIGNSEKMKEKSMCNAQCIKNLNIDKQNLVFLDTWKSKLINHFGADANTFGEGGEFSFDMYVFEPIY
jgi:hypothetical protein